MVSWLAALSQVLINLDNHHRPQSSSLGNAVMAGSLSEGAFQRHPQMLVQDLNTKALLLCFKVEVTDNRGCKHVSDIEKSNSEENPLARLLLHSPGDGRRINPSRNKLANGSMTSHSRQIFVKLYSAV